MVLRAKMKENLLHYTEGDEKEQHKEVPEEEKFCFFLLVFLLLFPTVLIDKCFRVFLLGNLSILY